MYIQRFLFVSRHEATPEQKELAHLQGIELIQGTDLDAFSIKLSDLSKLLVGFSGAVVVHPMLAMKVAMLTQVGIYENGSRPAEGGKPQFYAKSLVVLPPASRWEKMRQPCDCCSVIGAYCGSSGHISCGEFKNELPIPYSEVLGLE